MSEIYILKKRGGLGKLEQIKEGFTTYSAQTQSENEEGINQGSYTQNTFPGAVKELNLAWSTLTDSFCFAGSTVDLKEIVKAAKLKYEKGHISEGKLIAPEDVDLGDFNDPFFRHSYWDNRKVATDGECLLNTSVNDDRLFLLSYKANPKCIDKSTNEFSPWEASAEWELISPEVTEALKSKEVNQIIDILSSLKGMEVSKREMFCNILNLDYNKDIKEDSTVTSLYDAILNPAKQKKLGGLTYGEKLEQLFKLPKDKLTIYSDVVQGMATGIIRNNGGNFNFNAESPKALKRIDVRTEVELPEFFSSVDNQDQYIILREELEKRLK